MVLVSVNIQLPLEHTCTTLKSINQAGICWNSLPSLGNSGIFEEPWMLWKWAIFMKY